MEWGMEGPASSDFDPDLLPPGMEELLEDEEFLRRYYGDERFYDDDGGGAYDFQDYDENDMPYESYPDDGGAYGDQDMYYSRISAGELLDQCVLPTLSQACQTVLPLLGLCIVTRITVYFTQEVLQGGGTGRLVAHGCSALCGLVALHWFFKENIIFLVMLALLAYLLLWATLCKCRGLSGIMVAMVTVVYLVTCELLVVKEAEWHQIRGAQMILAMKVISLAFDLAGNSQTELPGPLEYSGYVFQVGSVVFGPWISFQDYSHPPTAKDRKLDFYWVAKVVKSFVLSFLCVIVSTCVIHWIILEYSFVWFLAFRDAQSFRFSHYFVCYLSELTLTLSGQGASKNNGDVRWDLKVTRPFHVEFPRSLVEVVTNWNLSMHQWLKTYVFKNARPWGTLPAILLTYGASSLLHGLNFQLAAVLMSLGLYSYVEYALRTRLSKSFDACIQTKRCKPECQHGYKSTHPYVLLVNVGFGLLTVFHLAYLGLMFDSSTEEEQGYTMEHTTSKWAELGYASHWVALATYIFYLLI